MTQTVQFLPFDQPLPASHRADCDAAARLSYTLDADWFQHLAAHALPAGARAYWCLAETGAEDRACLPLALRDDANGALVNYYSTYYTPVLSRPEAAALLPGMLTALRQRWPGVGRWWFYPADPAAPAQVALFAALRGAGLIPFRYFCFGNWHLPCAGMDWEAYLKTRTSKMRSNIKRMSRKLEEAGGVLEVLTTPEQAEEAIRAYETVYASSWKKPEPFPEFMPGLVRLAAAKGWLRMGVVRLDGAPVAAQLWLACQGRAAIYKVAYDERCKDYSPGLVLTAHLLRHALEQDRVTEVDYLMGDDEYKRTWMSERRERWGIVAYNPRTPAGLLGLAQEWAGRAAKTLGGRLRRGKGG
ncbi:MAG: GNAT family N-acetyltransferase [Betaproteobacteria bacterium]|nr:GNAT family N-acetyltransferase [Betaproteobacteria bacterium]